MTDAASDIEDLGIDDYRDEVSTFGDRIVVAREAMGLSTAELARRLGIKVDTLTKWEEDRAEPRANKLQMLAGVLNVSIIWLMSGEGAAPRIGDGEESLSEQNAEMVMEVRQIRELHGDLGQRLARLERRLRASTQ